MAASICIDTFILRIIVQIDANITIPGSFPLIVEPGSNYFIGFMYITGIPAATGWHISWTIVDDDDTMFPEAERPSVMIAPEVPEQMGNLGEIRNGTVRGTVPTPSTNRQYNAIVRILQA